MSSGGEALKELAGEVMPPGRWLGQLDGRNGDLCTDADKVEEGTHRFLRAGRSATCGCVRSRRPSGGRPAGGGLEIREIPPACPQAPSQPCSSAPGHTLPF